MASRSGSCGSTIQKLSMPAGAARMTGLMLASSVDRLEGAGPDFLRVGPGCDVEGDPVFERVYALSALLFGGFRAGVVDFRGARCVEVRHGRGTLLCEGLALPCLHEDLSQTVRASDLGELACDFV